MGRESYESVKRDIRQHYERSGKPITERQAERLARDGLRRAEVLNPNVFKHERGGERP